MTYDKKTDDSSAYDPSQHQHGPFGGRRSHFGGGQGWDGMSWASRPGFHPMKALTVLGGFAIFPPLGVLALGYFLWNSRSSFGRHDGPGPQQFAGGPGMGRGCGRGMRGRFTGMRPLKNIRPKPSTSCAKSAGPSLSIAPSSAASATRMPMTPSAQPKATLRTAKTSAPPKTERYRNETAAPDFRCSSVVWSAPCCMIF